MNRDGPPETQSFPIIGVGASAGGLEAFTHFLGALPAHTGMAFVLLQHLDPRHKSNLVELLSQTTTLPVIEVAHMAKVSPDVVYIVPENTEVRIKSGILRLHPRPSGKQPSMLIDRFFTSLARDQRQNAVGIVLSGMANDGTKGLQAIQSAGGLTFAQGSNGECARHAAIRH